MIDRATVSEILALLGNGACILHSPLDDGDGGGGDIDCAVPDLDVMWPLHLVDGWRLCQRLHYDPTGWHWILERDGEILAIDTLTDPDGLGRYGFPTSLIPRDVRAVAPPEIRAAYLTAKRIRKGQRQKDKWKQITDLADREPHRFTNALRLTFGRSASRSLSEAVLEGRVPGPRVWRSARASQMLRRARNPIKAVRLMMVGLARIVERVRHPTGMVILLGGPDGTGKSALAGALPGACAGLFRKNRHYHWRPGLLPRAGAVVGAPAGDPQDPHGRRPHGRALSLALIFYNWLDFFIGGWLKFVPARVRSTLIVVERGWWDLEVDPRRYRLHPYPRLIRFLGRLLVKPDLVLVLDAPASTLAARKDELPEEELERQRTAWVGGRAGMPLPTILDASGPIEGLVRSARESIVGHLEDRSIARLGPGWAVLPFSRSPRWWIPRGPSRTVRAALSVYQPVTRKGRLGWEGARLLAYLGIFRLLPRGAAPPIEVRSRIRPHIPRGGTFAVSRANHPGRFVTLLMDKGGRAAGLAKLATEDADRRSLEREAEAMEEIGSLLPSPLRPPRVLDVSPGLLLFEAVGWMPRTRPSRVPLDVARALGSFFAARAQWKEDGVVGPAHGDFAPWNLLRSAEGWTMVDWEDATDEAPPFFDLFHYWVQGHSLLGRPSAKGIIRGLQGEGSIGRCLEAYAEAAGIDRTEAVRTFALYLHSSKEGLPLGRSEGRRGLEVRESLLSAAQQ
ncbi:MAG: hypothetical protein ACRDI3_01070 [Actinomycetota bacterium]